MLPSSKNKYYLALKQSSEESSKLLHQLKVAGLYKEAGDLIGQLYNKSLEKRRDLFGNNEMVELKSISDSVLPDFEERFYAKKMVRTINLASLAHHIINDMDYMALIENFFEDMDKEPSTDCLIRSYFKLRYCFTSFGSDADENDALSAQVFPIIAKFYRDEFVEDSGEDLFTCEMVKLMRERFEYIQNGRDVYDEEETVLQSKWW